MNETKRGETVSRREPKEKVSGFLVSVSEVLNGAEMGMDILKEMMVQSLIDQQPCSQPCCRSMVAIISPGHCYCVPIDPFPCLNLDCFQCCPYKRHGRRSFLSTLPCLLACPFQRKVWLPSSFPAEVSS